jgi:hypothetical protein
MRETPRKAGRSRIAFALLFAGLSVLLAGGAACAQASWPISASAADNGAISPTGIVYVADGAGQSFTFVPNSGYLVYEVIVDGNVVAGNAAGYAFDAVHGQHSILVTFTPASGIQGYGGVVVSPPDLYLFGGGYDRERDVRDYRRRGSESRAAAHPENRGAARPAGGERGGRR